MKKLISSLILTFGFVLLASAQSEMVQEEKVEGLGNVMGYFSQKLGKELGTRLNLEEGGTEEQVEMVPTKVKVKLGPFTIERTEYRPKKKEDTAEAVES